MHDATDRQTYCKNRARDVQTNQELDLEYTQKWAEARGHLKNGFAHVCVKACMCMWFVERAKA